ncbi:hypothetical protein ACWCSH_25680, partial [Streptosporangium sp. NPDC001682]
VAIARGPSPGGEPYPRGYLTATSIRQDGLVANTDLTATAIEAILRRFTESASHLAYQAMLFMLWRRPTRSPSTGCP